MNLQEVFVPELRHEAATTRTMLERVPEGALGWRPHERSRTLGQLAGHVADIPGLFLASLREPGPDRETYASETGSVAGILATLDRNVAAALDALAGLDDERFLEPWTYRYGGRVVFELPRLVVARSTGLNHLVHHRGQLTVYLRLLGGPLPAVHGPTADEP
jgi:uncharacterized damage-inducible protein DinB